MQIPAIFFSNVPFPPLPQREIPEPKLRDFSYFSGETSARRQPGLLPALVMTYVCASYIFVSPLMFGMQNRTAAYLLGGAVTLAVLVAMIFKLRNNDAKGFS